jgi:hypothetical protein
MKLHRKEVVELAGKIATLNYVVGISTMMVIARDLLDLCHEHSVGTESRSSTKIKSINPKIFVIKYKKMLLFLSLADTI